MFQTISPVYRMFFYIGLGLMFWLCADVASASTTTGGGLPFDSWFTKIQSSITGPFAFTVSIVGIVSAGATMIFGGEMNGFLRTLVFIVLVLSFVIGAEALMTAVTGKGAVLPVSAPHAIQQGHVS